MIEYDRKIYLPEYTEANGEQDECKRDIRRAA